MERLDDFLLGYERAANSHDFSVVEPFIASDATYWFSDGSFSGLPAIRRAFEATWAKIRDDTYQISAVNWLSLTDAAAVCIYNFRWNGVVDGKPRDGRGRGTNLIVRNSHHWQILHEHLSVSS